MKFGFYLPCYWPDISYPVRSLYREMTDEARFAEDLGFNVLSVPEHHFLNTLVHPSPLLTAVHVASATKHVPIVTAVLVLPFHDMRRLAGEICQADCLTGGRLQLGVGRGAFRYEFDRMGIPFDEAKSRFAESLQVLIKLLSEEEVSWQGQYYNFDTLTITPRPVQHPHPPIWIAALNSESIADAARRGFSVMTTPLRDAFGVARDQALAFTKAMGEVGPSTTNQRFAMLRNCYVSESRTDTNEKVALGVLKQRQFASISSSQSEVSRGQIKLSDVSLTAQEIENNIIIGSPEQCIEKLSKYAELGVDELHLNMNFGASHQDVMFSLERFATEVMPHFS
jgi:alkanesulfonate monooxygenase SsuD/methylene tetrahydromethanopterin reductase-like flavin-dependent oxidoreductase (luciferase family)